jgi:anion-transporting  ArsA/GET3 family ATPase
MTRQRKQLIRVVFDVVDEHKQQIRSNEDLSVAATDPDEAIDWVFAEMQRQFNRSDILLTRVRICA